MQVRVQILHSHTWNSIDCSSVKSSAMVTKRSTPTRTYVFMYSLLSVYILSSAWGLDMGLEATSRLCMTNLDADDDCFVENVKQSRVESVVVDWIGVWEQMSDVKVSKQIHSTVSWMNHTRKSGLTIKVSLHHWRHGIIKQIWQNHVMNNKNWLQV